MPRPSTFETYPDKTVYTIASVVQRINHKLADCIPHRRLYYDAVGKDYFITTISPNPAEHGITIGPYYYIWFIALADMLNVWSLAERGIQPKAMKARGSVYDQEPLPSHLHFPVVTAVLQDALRALDTHEVQSALVARGWTPPPGVHVEPVVERPRLPAPPLGTVTVNGLPYTGILKGVTYRNGVPVGTPSVVTVPVTDDTVKDQGASEN